MAIKDLTLIKKHLFLCNGGTCKLKGAEESTAAIRASLVEKGLENDVHTTKTLCNGRCKEGPIVISATDGLWFKQMTADVAGQFVREFIVEGNVPDEHRLFAYGESEINSLEPEAQAQN
ncbi:MAG: (2Fe-2S) ferredoxin domain-containing protein [Bacteroidota bacterium]